MDEQDEINFQRRCGELVSREVRYCVSALVHELAQDEKHLDDLLPVLVQDDWQTPAEEAGFFEDDEGDICGPDEDQVYNDWQSACEDNNIDPYQAEAYEHWIVSDWLADKLGAKGEMIVRDFLGLTIWGRATTGQAIAIDRVIREIMLKL